MPQAVLRPTSKCQWPLLVLPVPEPGRIGGVLPASPPGHVWMLTDYISEQQRFVSCPNQDTVYGAGYQRVATKPVVIQVPDFKDSERLPCVVVRGRSVEVSMKRLFPNHRRLTFRHKQHEPHLPVRLVARAKMTYLILSQPNTIGRR